MQGTSAGGRDPVAADVRVGFEDSRHELGRDVEGGGVGAEVRLEDGGRVDLCGAEGGAFVRVGAVDDGDFDEVAFRELLAGPAGDEVAVDDGLEFGGVCGGVEDGV